MKTLSEFKYWDLVTKNFNTEKLLNIIFDLDIQSFIKSKELYFNVLSKIHHFFHINSYENFFPGLIKKIFLSADDKKKENFFNEIKKILNSKIKNSEKESLLKEKIKSYNLTLLDIEMIDEISSEEKIIIS